MKNASLILLFAAASLAQPYDLLLKGGTVIDPKNGINARRDVAIAGSKIAAVAANIPSSLGKKVVDVSRFYVTPGLVDIHVHVYAGAAKGELAGGLSSLIPDQGVRRKSDLNQKGPNRLKRGARHKSDEGISMEDAIPGLHKNS